jgi:hypothetical protein
MDRFQRLAAQVLDAGNVGMTQESAQEYFTRTAMQTKELSRTCANCGYLGCTPGDYMCADCRVEIDPVDGKWWFGGGMSGSYALVWIISRYEGYTYVMDKSEHRKVYAVGSGSITPCNSD